MNNKAIKARIRSAKEKGDLTTLKRELTTLFSEGTIADVKACSDALTAPSSPSAHALVYMTTEEYVLQNNYYSLCNLLSIVAEAMGDTTLSLYWADVYEGYFGKRDGKEKKIDPVAGEFYQDEWEGHYLYEGKKYDLAVFSFAHEIGRNMTLLKTRYGAILFDCGAGALREDRREIDKESFFDFLSRCGVTVGEIVAVFISHAHLDHYGSVAALLSFGIEESKIYTDPTTLRIVREQMPAAPFLNVHAQYYHAKLKVEPFYNGHILGSCGYVVSFDGQNVVYTGDFCLHDQKTVAGLNVKDVARLGTIAKHGVTLLVTESTYGQDAGRLGYTDHRYIFTYFLSRAKKLGMRCLCPAFAVGRSQEILLLSDKKTRTLVSGDSVRLTKVYEKSLKRNFNRENLRMGEDKYRFELAIASSGMLARDSAACRYAERMMTEEEGALLLLSGYMAEEGYGYDVMREWVKAGKTLLKVPLSAHADRRELIELIEKLAPRRVVTIHGEGLAGAEYKNEGAPKPAAIREGGYRLTTEEVSDFNVMRLIGAISDVNLVARKENPVYEGRRRSLAKKLRERGEEGLACEVEEEAFDPEVWQEKVTEGKRKKK